MVFILFKERLDYTLISYIALGTYNITPQVAYFNKNTLYYLLNTNSCRWNYLLDVS